MTCPASGLTASRTVWRVSGPSTGRKGPGPTLALPCPPVPMPQAPNGISVHSFLPNWRFPLPPGLEALHSSQGPYTSLAQSPHDLNVHLLAFLYHWISRKPRLRDSLFFFNQVKSAPPNLSASVFTPFLNSPRPWSSDLFFPFHSLCPSHQETQHVCRGGPSGTQENRLFSSLLRGLISLLTQSWGRSPFV